MSFKNWKLLVYERQVTSDARSLIELFHYSGTVRSQKPIFTYHLIDEIGDIKAVAIIGQPCGRKVNEYYGGDIVELRRMVITRPAKKNTGSFFISKIVKHLKLATNYYAIISYADPNYGHLGGLYRASNFAFMGEELGPNPRKLNYNGRKYTMREMYQKNKDKQYTPKAIELQTAWKSGNAELCDFEKKLIYGYQLKGA